MDTKKPSLDLADFETYFWTKLPEARVQQGEWRIGKEITLRRIHINLYLTPEEYRDLVTILVKTKMPMKLFIHISLYTYLEWLRKLLRENKLQKEVIHEEDQEHN